MQESSSEISHPVKPFIPLAAAALFTLTLLIVAQCQYETNDDMTIIRLLSGRNGLDATPDGVFLSLPLGALLYKLYSLAGNIPWYGIVLYSALTAGCGIGLKIIFASSTEAINRIICTIIFLCFYSHLVCQLNFAGASLFVWLTAIAAITLSNLDRRDSMGENLTCGIMLALSFLIRPDLLLVSLAFSTPGIATLPFSCTKRKLAALFIPLLLTLTLSTACNIIYRTSPEHLSYAEFNKSRSDLLDLHSGEPNSKTVIAMASVGWSIYDYILAGDWWLHDSTLYNSSSFKKFTDQNSSRLTRIVSAKASLQAITRYKLPLVIFATCLVWAIISSARACKLKDRELYAVILSFSATLIAVALMFFIRFPPRVAFPVFCYLILLLTTAMYIFERRRFSSARIQSCMHAICLIAVAISSFIFIGNEYKNRTLNAHIKLFTDSTINQIKKMTPADSIFITANVLGFSYNSEATHPLGEYRNSSSIKDFPAGWLIDSSSYNRFLENNGFGNRSTVVQNMLGNDRVIFSYWQSPDENFDNFINNFLEHLKGRYSSELQGKRLQTTTILDNRGVSGNFGWVFFRINALPG